jgi:hypothetical protein
MINEEESQIGKNLRNAMANEFGALSSQMSGTEFLSSANSMMKGIQEEDELEEEGSEKRNIPQDYLKDRNGLKLVFDLSKQKRTNKATIRKEIKKLLKNPEEINDFLNSILSFVKSEKGNDKEETKEMTGAVSAGGYSAQLFSVNKKDLEEIGKVIYKENFTAPKLTMFSDEAPKKIETKESKKKESDVIKRTFKKSEVDKIIGSKKIKTPIGKTTTMLPVMGESEDMSDEIKKVEATESTGSDSSGSYSTPAAWSKSMSKKDWRGKSKTQIPGGKFVQVKKKCKKFPYCNQGDIKALKLTNENEDLLEVIKNVSRKQGISENMIKNIIFYEYQKHKLNK